MDISSLNIGSCTRADSDIIGKLNAPGFNVIVLDTLEAANALLDERSEICSSV